MNLRHSRDYNADCQNCDEEAGKIEVLERTITLQGDLSDEQRERLLQIAERCPVHRTLHNKLQVRTLLDAEPD